MGVQLGAARPPNTFKSAVSLYKPPRRHLLRNFFPFLFRPHVRYLADERRAETQWEIKVILINTKPDCGRYPESLSGVSGGRSQGGRSGGGRKADGASGLGWNVDGGQAGWKVVD